MLMLGVTFFNGLTQYNNVFPIPIPINTKIQKKSFSTFGKINKYKLDPLAQQILFLQKENGGFNLKETEIMKNPTCGLSYILTYIRYLQNMKINKIKSSNPKTPFYYFDLVDYTKKNQNTTITKEKPQKNLSKYFKP